MKVSVAIATYNGSKYIIKQLESIVNQTQSVDEVIIYDDKSTDDTVVLIQKFIHKYKLNTWKLSVNKQNLGFNENFRQALQRTSGEVVFLCDQDDEWSLNKVEVMCSIMQSSKILSLASSYQTIDANSQNCESENLATWFFNEEIVPQALVNITLQKLLKRNFMPGCTIAVKRELINELQKDGNRNVEHDWSLLLLAALNNGCFYYNEKLMGYRIHESNTIGVNFLDKEFRRNRVAMIKNELDRVCFINQYQNDEELRMYENALERRISLIESNDFFVAFKLLFNKNLRQVFGLKPLVGDIVFILRD